MPFSYFSRELNAQWWVFFVFLLTRVLHVYPREDNFKKYAQTTLQPESGELYDTSFLFSQRTFALVKMTFWALRTHVISGSISDRQNLASDCPEVKNQECITSCGIWRVLKNIVPLKDWSFVSLKHAVLVLRDGLLSNKTWDEMLLVNAVVWRFTSSEKASAPTRGPS